MPISDAPKLNLRFAFGRIRSQFAKVAWSPDSQSIAAAGEDGVVWLWRVGEWKPSLLEGHWGPINDLSWSPDGKVIASGSNDATVRLWDAGGAVRTLEGHSDFVNIVAWSPDGKAIASGSNETIWLWDAATGHTLQTLKGHTNSVTSVVWSPDGKTIASGSADNRIRLWDAATGRTGQILVGHSQTVTSVAWSPDGKTLASGSDDDTGRLWDASGRPLAILEGHRGFVKSIVWSPDGTTLATASHDRTVRLWDAASGRALRTLEHYGNSVNTIVWSPDGKTIASGSDDKTIRLWDVANGGLVHTPAEHGGPVHCVSWSPNGATLASASLDSTVVLWDVGAGRALRVLEGHRTGVNTVAWSPDGKIAASGSDDNLIRLSDAATGVVQRTLVDHINSINQVAWSPDSKAVASGSDDSTIRLWDPATGRALRTLLGHTGHVTSVAWSPDSRMVASASESTIIHLWDAATGSALQTLKGHNLSVSALMWSPDGATIASGSYDGTVRLWDAATGSTRSTLEGSSEPVRSLAWSPDGTVVASGCADSTVRLWQAANGRAAFVLEGHTHSVRHLAWSADGRLLASLGVDGDVFLWDAQTGDRIAGISPRTYRHVGVGLAFAPDSASAELDNGDFVVYTLSFDGLARKEEQTFVTTAKVVLAGDSNAGKTCLARRLAEDQFIQGQATTHGMQVWTLAAATLHPDGSPPPGQIREVFLWDLGGQDEYQLVNQLFLNDTTVALVLFDPTRGSVSLESAEAWTERLTARAHTPISRLLVPTKADQPGIVREADIQHLEQHLGFHATIAVSATRDGDQGIATLRRELNRLIGWDQLALTSRPTAFHEIREVINRLRQSGSCVVFVADLEKKLTDQGVAYEPRDLDIVLQHLGREGQIVEVRHWSRDRVLVLRIDAVSRYAGSLVQTARKHPRGAPVLEQDRILAAEMSFPGMARTERLASRQEEKTVLECVARLMIERGLCFDHQGLLVFPTLFDELAAHPGPLPPSAPIYYDFSGPIDNIFASLVARLTVSQKFGAIRLWNRHAEFGPNAEESFGIRRADRSKGKGHLDLFFGEKTAADARRLFRDFVDDHLTTEGVKVSSGLAFPCQKCGYQFSKETIARRLRDNKNEVHCPECDEVYSLFAGMLAPEQTKQLAALKTDIEAGLKQSDRRVVAELKKPKPPKQEPLRILHLSDLHFTGETNSLSVRQPLEADLRDNLGITTLDYLVLSGDFADKCNEKGWLAATQFVQDLMSVFGMGPLKVILAPGNHDYQQNMDHFDVKLVPTGHDKDGNPTVGGVPQPNARYNSRFTRFGAFYHGIYSASPYPEDPSKQFDLIDDPDLDLRFLVLNSAWQIDQFHPERASLNNDALSAALVQGKTPKFGILVWHHAVSGDRQITGGESILKLGAAGYRVLLHGDVHEERDVLLHHLDKKKRIYAVGGGAFGAAANDRPQSTPRLYSLLEVARDQSNIRVIRRRQKTPEGPYDAYAIYPTRNPNLKKAEFTIKL